MLLAHPQLVRSLQLAYSAERAASYAYIGHAASLRDPQEKQAVRRIEQDEWDHRSKVLEIMRTYEIPVSRYFELKYWMIGRLIGFSCLFIGRFMPYFFAGKLESGNVCEYFVMIHRFHSLGITVHDQQLFEMGVKEKEHEIYFLDVIRHASWLPWFEWLFGWGLKTSLNDLGPDAAIQVNSGDQYCRNDRNGSRREDQRANPR